MISAVTVVLDAAGALVRLLEAGGQGSARRRQVEAVPDGEPVEDLRPAGHPGHADRGGGVDRAGAGAGLRARRGPAVDHTDPVGVLGHRGVLPRRPGADHDDLRVLPLRAVRRLPVEASGAGRRDHRSDAVQRRGDRRDRARRRQCAAAGAV